MERGDVTFKILIIIIKNKKYLEMYYFFYF